MAGQKTTSGDKPKETRPGLYTVHIAIPSAEYQFYKTEAEADDRPVSSHLLRRIRRGGLVQPVSERAASPSPLAARKSSKGERP